MNRPVVTICVPAYNAVPCIAESLTSILNQTSQELKVIEGDNCSTGDTVETVSRIQAADSRVRLLRHERNMGGAGSCWPRQAPNSSPSTMRDIYEPPVVTREVAVLLETRSGTGVFCKARYPRGGEPVGPPQKQKFLERDRLPRGNGYV